MIHEFSVDFLLVGAMKAGTSSLFTDLQKHPDVFFPEWKEPGYFCGPEFQETDEKSPPLATTKQYKALYSSKRPDQMAGDASTHYAKLPDFPNVPERVLDNLGSKIKIVYMMRDPVARAISHYKHDRLLGHIDDISILEAISQFPRYGNYSRYDLQFSAWREHFSEEQFCVVNFEKYVSDPSGERDRVLRFLNLDPKKIASASRSTTEKVNASDQRIAVPSAVRLITNSSGFLTYIRPFLPRKLRRALGTRLFGTVKKVEIDASKEEISAALNHYLTPSDYAFYEKFK